MQSTTLFYEKRWKKQSKRRRWESAGMDNIPAELVQAGGEAMIILTTICNKIWKIGEWPTTWTQSLVTTLPKKGNLQLCQNYRTISHPSKVKKRKKGNSEVRPHLELLGHGEDNSAGDSERRKKERKTRRDGMITSRNGRDWGLEIPWGSGRQGRVEPYCCNVICGAPTTCEVNGTEMISPKTLQQHEWQKRQCITIYQASHTEIMSNHIIIEPQHYKTNKMTCAPNEDSDQPDQS